MRAVADTGPLHYLILIGEADLLRLLFDDVVIPQTVFDELVHPASPGEVRSWMAQPPPWLIVKPDLPVPDEAHLPNLDSGESAAIALPCSLRPGLVLMDDRAGVDAARRMGFQVTGTLGLLYRAAQKGHANFKDSLIRLQRTNFRHKAGLLDRIAARFRAGETLQ